MMVEGEAKECSEEDLLQALQLAHDAIRIQIKAQQELREIVGVAEKRDYPKPEQNEAIQTRVNELGTPRMLTLARANVKKAARKEEYDAIREYILETLKQEANLTEGEELPDQTIMLVKTYLSDLQYHIVRDMILYEKIRLDGRALDQVRTLDMEIDVLPTPHGSALFTRGETQSLTTITLGTPLDELLIESAGKSVDSKFYLHYNFPPFSTGEVKFLRGASRREIGHGKLAERSLKQLMPAGDFAYTVRIVSDILESNGSSSMATVCAGSLALMDAGIPVPKHIAGVAMGLISKDGKFAVLTDILGDEDHLGDMDFKVTGTREGICGIQMDIKVDGLPIEIMRQALEQARRGRLHILDAMYDCMPAARSDVKPHAPRMVKLYIDREFIGAVIGPGGKIIQEIQRETNTTINLEEKNDQGEVSIFGSIKENVDKAAAWVKGIVSVPEEGEEYEAVVKSIMPYGAFVEFMPGKQGLLHISEVSWKRLDTLEGVLREGEKIKVKLVGVDQKTGKFKLSRKVLMPKPEGTSEDRRGDGQRNNNRPRFEERRDDRSQRERPKIERPHSQANEGEQEQQTPSEQL
jgi:polyribonucleotide nucleotidyltransferase